MVENVTRFKRFTTKTFTFSFFKKTPEEQFRANTESYRSASVLEQKDDDGVFFMWTCVCRGKQTEMLSRSSQFNAISENTFFLVQVKNKCCYMFGHISG